MWHIKFPANEGEEMRRVRVDDIVSRVCEMGS